MPDKPEHARDNPQPRSCAGGTVSEAEVEAAAIAIHDGEYDATRYPWQTETIATRQGYREMARAALEAAAKVREGKYVSEVNSAEGQQTPD